MQILVCGDGSSPSNSATRYNTIYGPGRTNWNSNESYMQDVMPTSGTFRYMRFRGAPPGAGTRTFTLRVNGADSALTFDWTGTDTLFELWESVAVSEGDLVCIAAVPTSSPNNGSFTWELGFEPDVYGETIIFANSGGSVVVASSGRFLSMSGDTAGDSTSAFDTGLLMPISGTFKKMRAKQLDPPGTGDSRIYTLVKNGTDTSMTFTISGNTDTTGSTTSNTFTASEGDNINIRIDEGGATTNTRIKVGICFVPDRPDLFICSGNSPSNLTAGTFYNHNITGFALWSSALGNYIAPSPRWIALKKVVEIDVAPGVGQTRTFASNNFLVQPGFRITISGTNTLGSSDGSLVAGYDFLGTTIPNTLLYTQASASAGAATTSVRWSYACKDRLTFGQ